MSATAQRPTQGVGNSGSRQTPGGGVLLTGAVEATMPADGATGVPLDRNTSLFFNTPLDPATVTGTSIFAAAGPSLLPTGITLSANRRVVTLDYPFFLPASSTIEVTVDGDVLRSQLGLPIDADADGRLGGVGLIEFQTGPAVPGPVTTAAATILGSVADTGGNPVEGATVEAWYYPRTDGAPPLPGFATSGPDGRFELQTAAFTGAESFLVAITSPDHTEVLRRVDVLAGRMRRVADVTLQGLASPVAVTAGVGGTVQDPTGAVSLIIPPDALGEDSSVGLTVLAGSAVLPDRLPPRVAAQGVFVEVAGVAGDQTAVPVTLQVPNTYDLPEGTRIPFGKLDENTLQWADLRDLYAGPGPVPDELLGIVKAGGPMGSFVEVQLDQLGTICTGYGAMLADPVATDNSGGRAHGESHGDADPGTLLGDGVVGLREGHLWETIELPTLREFGGEFGVSLGYFSGGASPSLTLAAQVDHGAQPVERTVFSFEIGGLVAEGVYASSDGTQKPIGTFLWPGLDGLGQTLATGAYAYTIEATSLNASVPVSVPSAFSAAGGTSYPAVEYPGLTPLSTGVQGRGVLVNLAGSPYGAGWSLLEEQRIHVEPDGRVVLVQGHGDWRLFDPDPSAPNVYLSPPGESSTLLFNPENGGFVRTCRDGSGIEFNASGRIERITDRYDNATVYSYTDDLLTGITSPTGHQLVITYDPAGRLSRIEDSAQRGTDFVVDAFGDLISVTDAAGLTSQFEYDGGHLLLRHIGPRGERTEYTWSAGRLVQSENFDTDGTTLLRRRILSPSVLGGEVGTAIAMGQGTEVDPIPVAVDRVDLLTDGRDVVSDHTTDETGRTAQRRDGLGRVTAYTWAGGRLVTVTRPDGSVTSHEYDTGGNETVTRELSDAVTEYSSLTRDYDGPFDQLTHVVDQEGAGSHFSYDERGRLVAVQDHDGGQVQLFYQDPVFEHLPSRIRLPTGEKVDLTFDAHGNVLTLKDFPDPYRKPEGRTLGFAYDAAGNVSAVTDRRGETTWYTHDAKNRITSVTDSLLRTTGFDYGQAGCGCVATVTLPGGPTIGFQHDGLCRTTSRVDPFGNATSFTYDAESNLVTSEDRNGDSITYVYDPAGQLVEKRLPGNEVTVYEYDSRGRLTSATDPSCSLLTSYDFLGRLVEATSLLDLGGGPDSPVAHVSTYGYDRIGNRTSMTDDTGLVDLIYSRDNLHRLIGLNESNIPAGTWTLSYDASGRRRFLVRPNATATAWIYDLVGRMVVITHGTIPPITLGFAQVDGNGNALGEARQGGNQSFSLSFSYDPLRQLERVASSLVSGELAVDRSYTYDIADRLLEDEDFTYGYDLEGRLISKVHKATGVTDRFQYDAEGRLRRYSQEVDVQGSPEEVLVVTHGYDPLGRRYRKSVNGVVTKYIYDQRQILHELDGRNRIVRTLTYGPGGYEPLAVRDMVADQTLFFHADRLASVVALSDTFGALVQEYLYDELGNPLRPAGPVVPSLSWTGHEHEADSGLYYLGARFYDPAIGRFLSQDPRGLGGGLNLYRYAGNNPTNPAAGHSASELLLRNPDLVRRSGIPSLPSVRLPR